MKLTIFHPETNELIGQEEFYYSAVGEYLRNKGYPDQCYFHKEASVNGTHFKRLWCRFCITKDQQTKLSAGIWVEIHPDDVPASARATALLLA